MVAVERTGADVVVLTFVEHHPALPSAVWSIELGTRTTRYPFELGNEYAMQVIYPRDWWQAVKARFAPLWLRRRWPVMQTICEYVVILPDTIPW